MVRSEGAPVKIAAVIPAYNEADTIGDVVRCLLVDSAGEYQLDRVVVVDNRSTDRTAQRACAAGAEVATEERRGYGAACLRGIDVAADADSLVFVDGDGSDKAQEWPLLVEPIIKQGYDIVIGSRVLGSSERGALSSHQRLGNCLATFLLSTLYGARFSDLGPFRAIRTAALKRLQMCDTNYGWTVEMQLKAVQAGLRWKEVPVSYRCRQGGRSKISGTLAGSFRAAYKILGWIFLGKLWTLRGCSR